MMRKKRCKECKVSFYTAVDGTKCQDCTDSAPDKSQQQAKEDAAKIKAVGAAKGESQTVDIRKLKATPKKVNKNAKPSTSRGNDEPNS